MGIGDNDFVLSELDRLLAQNLNGAPAPEPKAERTKTVLVIDDNADYRNAVVYLLQDAALRVLEAADGVSGLKLAVEKRPDLLLVDFHIPGLNGYELIQELKRSWETRKIPIVMLTAAPNREHIKELDLGIEDFLYKPVSNKRLLEVVFKTLGVDPAPAEEPARQASTPAPPPAPSPASQRACEPIVLENFPGRAENGLEELEPDAESKAPPEEEGLEEATQESTLVSQVNRILISAVEMHASDIHIEPQEDKLKVRVRVNGSLRPMGSLPAGLSSRLSARVKIMANLVITERRLPQDGQFRVKIKGRKVEFRVSTLPSTYGEKIVIRVLGQSALKGSIPELGLSPRDLDCVERALKTPHGLILVTGPTGSGKTTTLYTMIAALNREDVNVLTAEDPVEYRLPGISQVQIMPAVGLNFESALRSFLRQDPDVMLIGEIRDKETAEIAVKASITGHIVLSTLHTNSAPATVTRLTHMGLAPYLVAASVKLVVAQRLIKVLCPACKRPGPLSEEDRKFLTPEEAGRLEQAWRPVGCPACNRSGYSGRKPIFEVMPVTTPRMRQTILSSQDADELGRLAEEEGMTTLRQAALEAAVREETSLEEALKVMFAQ